jgi:DNA-binding response OmpR family regulator
MIAAPPPTLLLVEDQALLLINVEETLREAGFETVALSDGQNALNEIERDCARFSALVTDIDLGNAPSGWDVARRARELCSTLAVVRMSGASAHEWAALGVPNIVMLQKPFVAAQLVTAVATLINQAPITAGPDGEEPPGA